MEVGVTKFGSLTNYDGKQQLQMNVNGTDAAQLLEAIEKPLKKKTDDIQATIDKNAKVLGAVNEFNAKLTLLRDLSKELSNPSPFSGVQNKLSSRVCTLSSDTGKTIDQIKQIVDFKAEDSVPKIPFNVLVTSCATKDEIMGTVNWAASDTPITLNGGVGGNLTINGVDVPLTDGMTLQQIKDKVNSYSAQTNVIVTTPKINGKYYLNLNAQHTGAAITLASAGTIMADLGLAVSGKTNDDLSTHLTFNGKSHTSTQNIITDIIPGLTIYVQGKDPATTVTVEVNDDINSIKQSMVDWVTTWNDIIDFYNKQTALDANGDPKEDAYLYNNFNIKEMLTQLQFTITNKAQGVSSTSIQNLSFAGIGFDDKTGKLSIREKPEMNGVLPDLNSILETKLDQFKSVLGFNYTTSNSRFFINQDHPISLDSSVAGKDNFILLEKDANGVLSAAFGTTGHASNAAPLTIGSGGGGSLTINGSTVTINNNSTLTDVQDAINTLTIDNNVTATIKTVQGKYFIHLTESTGKAVSVTTKNQIEKDICFMENFEITSQNSGQVVYLKAPEKSIIQGKTNPFYNMGIVYSGPALSNGTSDSSNITPSQGIMDRLSRTLDPLIFDTGAPPTESLPGLNIERFRLQKREKDELTTKLQEQKERFDTKRQEAVDKIMRMQSMIASIQNRSIGILSAFLNNRN